MATCRHNAVGGSDDVRVRGQGLGRFDVGVMCLGWVVRLVEGREVEHGIDRVEGSAMARTAGGLWSVQRGERKCLFVRFIF